MASIMGSRVMGRGIGAGLLGLGGGVVDEVVVVEVVEGWGWGLRGFRDGYYDRLVLLWIRLVWLWCV